MENIPVGACGTIGKRFTRESSRDFFLSAAGTGLFLVAFAVARRAGMAGESGLAIPAGCAAVFFLGLAVWPFVRMARRSDDWALSQAAMLAFFVFFSLDEKFPKGSAWRFATVLLTLVPAAVLLWSLIRLFRRADELQRRIVYEALAVAFVATLSVTVTGAFLQSAGLPTIGWIWIAGLLVVSWTVGLVTASRRYR
ncbi:MAG TPA: hypothetical protein VKJ00_09860 [Thermoanaerobaculia bacterium]|nr:hypothetical protein [Thermoanaerobaculia bacterium]